MAAEPLNRDIGAGHRRSSTRNRRRTSGRKNVRLDVPGILLGVPKTVLFQGKSPFAKSTNPGLAYAVSSTPLSTGFVLNDENSNDCIVGERQSRVDSVRSTI